MITKATPHPPKYKSLEFSQTSVSVFSVDDKVAGGLLSRAVKIEVQQRNSDSRA